MLRLPTLALLVLFVVPACSAVVQPDPGRLGSGGVDAPIVPREDAPIAPGEDVPVPRPDVPGDPCAGVVCEGGETCVDGSCVCPTGACCPGCEVGSLCVDGACEACGRAGEICCGDGSCLESSDVCYADLCRPCGDPSEPCCADGDCRGGATCNGALCVRDDCGNPGQPCCGGDTCNGTAVCVADIFSRTCRECGVLDGPCCAGGTCGSGMLVCQRGTCEACGGAFQACCAGGTCREGRCDGVARICRPG